MRAGLKVLTASIALITANAVSAQATPPQVWDGVVVPTNSAECQSSNPIAWPATYRPYISDAVSGASQPSQMVVFSRGFFQSSGLRLATTAAGQFNGNIDKTASVAISNADVDDQANSNTGSPSRVIHLVQTPNVVTATTKFIKITGTISNGGSPGLFCARSISAVFVKRPM